MYTEQPQLFAAVRSSHFASAAFAATDIRFDGASIPRAESSRILGHFHYFARKFVTQHTWVCVYGVPSGKSMEIASTNPNSMNAGEEALVVGGGPIGLAACQFAEAVGAKVAVIEINDWRRHFAHKLGVETLTTPDGRLADVVLDATGSATAMARSLDYVAPGGRLVFVGLTRDPVRIDDALLHRREITIYAGRNSCGQFPSIIRMLEERKINIDPWITDRLTLDEVPARFKELSEKVGMMKAVVEVRDSDG